MSDCEIRFKQMDHAVLCTMSSALHLITNNVLNKMGGGNILVYNRKAEEYLISKSQLDHTIIHPGGLIDDVVSPKVLKLGHGHL